MKNDIKTLRIQNFKSIKDVTMTPRRINIIIGEPNVGKSNILEAMSLLGGAVYEQSDKFMKSFIRYEKTEQLFYDNMLRNTIKVCSNNDVSIIGANIFDKKDNKIKYLFLGNEGYKYFLDTHEPYAKDKLYENEFVLNSFKPVIDKEGVNLLQHLDCVYTEMNNAGNIILEISEDNLIGFEPIMRWRDYESGLFVRSYSYRKDVNEINASFLDFLTPPNGNNLFDIIRTNKLLRQEVSQMFKPYGLKLMLRMDARRIEVVKDLDGIIYSYPYSSTADTLQRLIFYLAAIESNDDAVLLFEEPEAHSYPVYVSQLARRIVASRNNQFFVVTHSPYLITEVLEEMLTNDELTPELAMYVAYYEDYQTKVRQLSDEEVVAIRADGLDVFYNMARFVPSADNAV